MLKQNDERYSPEWCEDKKKASFYKVMLEDADIVRPIIKEQLFKAYIFGSGVSDEAFDVSCRLFGLYKEEKARMLIICPDGNFKSDELFFFKNIVEKSIDEEHLILNTIIRDCILVVTNVGDILNVTDKIHRLIKSCYNNDSVIVYSAPAELRDTAEMFLKLKRCLDYTFYFPDKKIFYTEDINISDGGESFEPQYVNIEQEVKNSDYKKSEQLIAEFFDNLEASGIPSASAKTYCIELYVCIIHCCEADKISEYMKGIAAIQESRYLSDIHKFILEKTKEIIGMNAPRKNIYSSLVREALSVIEENISNENLSLRWIAGSVLFTNVDYLGKLFKKETGKNFSHYVMEKRMEMAKELIMSGNKDRVYEIAENVGYGLNPQYFSQVFKKYTGYSPLEFRDYARKNK